MVFVCAGVLGLWVSIMIAQPLPVRLYGDSLDEQAHALVEAVDNDGFCIAG